MINLKPTCDKRRTRQDGTHTIIYRISLNGKSRDIFTGLSSFLPSFLPSWEFKNNFLFKEFTFRNFVDAFSFMTSIALEAEKMNHHSNWENVYNKVSISLNTHTAGSVTEKDFKLAGKVENIYVKYVGK